jgi:hypothetical protein
MDSDKVFFCCSLLCHTCGTRKGHALLHDARDAKVVFVKKRKD